jgi:cyclophilin family peptidyl-prolyl cis-trans isomerase
MTMRKWLAVLTILVAGSASVADAATANPRVRLETTAGAIVLELDVERAPLTVDNFLRYVRAGFYDGTVFHRVITNFVVQGGGYGADYQAKSPRPPIPNESGNGLSNRRGTVGLARMQPPHSGDSQFYINLADNLGLDPLPSRWGYTVFGRVVEGMDVVDSISHVATGPVGPFPSDVPLKPILLQKVTIEGEATPPAPAAGTPPAPPPPPPAEPGSAEKPPGQQ